MMLHIAEIISLTTVPLILAALCLCFIKDSSLVTSFAKGASEGLKTIVNILPTMTLLIVSLSLFSASGAADGISSFISPICTFLGIPSGIIPLVITKPFSGSASTAAYTSVLDTFGADSIEGFAASVLLGSGDTIVYVISVYYSATRVRNTRYVFPAAFFIYIFSVFLSCSLARIFFE